VTGDGSLVTPTRELLATSGTPLANLTDMLQRSGAAVSSYLAAVTGQIEADLGRSLGSGTTIVPAEHRGGSRTAVVYDLADRTVLRCDPALTDLLAPIAGPDTVSLPDAVQRCVELGGTPRGVGDNRVLEHDTVLPDIDVGQLREVWLDHHRADHIALLAGLRGVLSDEDAEEAEFDLDDLDDTLVGLVDDRSDPPLLVAQAGVRPWMDHSTLGDIGVTVHPEHRRRGLGAAVVSRCARGLRDGELQLMYRYDIENLGSKAVADAVGFTLVHSVAAVLFPDQSSDTG